MEFFKKSKKTKQSVPPKPNETTNSQTFHQYIISEIIVYLEKARANVATALINKYSICDAGIVMYYVISLECQQKFTQREVWSMFNNTLLLELFNALSKKYDIGDSELKEMVDNRLSLYDSLMPDVSSIFKELKLIFYMDYSENEYLPYNANSPLYFLDITETICCDVEVNVIVQLLPQMSTHIVSQLPNF